MHVTIIFGSKSDTDVMRGAARCLEQFNVSYTAHVLSAHRVPEKLEEVLAAAEEKGTECIIAGAGLAAHLPGVIASKTTLPVVGVPVKSALEGLDSLLSIVQMPKNIPVATVGINNSFNAGMMAVEILAIKYPELKEQLKQFRVDMKESFIKENEGEIKL